ncbi:MAG: tryptophan halogenase family protein [Pseudomonadota bacterium]|nr:tryptophan halogenase family protein [Pseudomonadota bacterium]
MKNQEVKNVVIVGGGTAGWMTAAALTKLIGKNLHISLVESDQIGTIGVGEATIPTFFALHQLLQINEAEFLAEVHGTIKLGIAFENWKQLDHQYIHAFGYTGQSCWAAGFQHFWLKAKTLGISEEYSRYSPELMAAVAGKFGLLQQNGLNYAYHIDATRYARYLRRLAEKSGARRIEGKIIQVKQTQDGDIASLHLDNGQTVQGDFFIDCSGFAGLLIDKTLNTGFQEWSQWLPCDRAVAVQTRSVSPPIPYTRSIAQACGWQWRIPLQSRVGNGLVYSSDYLSDDQATSLLLTNIQGDTLIEPRVIPFKTGQRHFHWKKNVVALGLAAGFLEPLESTSIHLIQRGIIRLMQMFPYGGINQPDQHEFNQQMSDEYEFIRDFIIMHYHITERTDTEFWRRNSAMSIPGSLQHRLSLFQESGRVFQAEGDVFGENSWTQVMLGQGLTPASYHPIVDMMSDHELRQFMRHQLQRVELVIKQLPDHNAFIAKYCPARL